MKNSQKGFIVPLLVAIIIILIGGGGTYVYLNKKAAVAPTVNNSSNSLKTFTHSSGAFSFQYPKNLVATEKESGIMISTIIDPAIPVFVVSPAGVSNFQSMGLDNPIFKRTTPKGYKVYTLNVGDSGQQVSYQLVSIDDNSNPSNFLMAYVFPNTIGFSDKDLESVLNSVSIDKTKVLTLINIINQSVESAKNKGLDAAIKATLANMRAEAELYYDSNHTSYSGLCTSKMVLLMIDGIKKAGSATSCFASSMTWSASAPLKSTPDIGYCVDAAGSYGTTSSPTQGLTGKCK